MKRFIIAVMALFVATIATAQQPLYVIDGRKATAEEIEKIISTKIESMTVIHDAEAKAAYSHMGDTTNGVVLVYTHKESATDEVWLAADVMPKFMGGDAASFQRWVMQNIKYPAEAIEKGIQGQVNVSFIVGKAFGIYFCFQYMHNNGCCNVVGKVCNNFYFAATEFIVYNLWQITF